MTLKMNPSYYRWGTGPLGYTQAEAAAQKERAEAEEAAALERAEEEELANDD